MFPRRRAPSSILLLGVVLALAQGGDAAAEADPVRFNRDIRPILVKNCVACHGPDEGDRKAGFRIDTFVGATETRDGVRGIVPGEPDESAVIERITHEDPAERMPPDDHGHALEQAEIALLRTWIAQGADYETHWSFVPPERPDPPGHPFGNWAANPVDDFVAARLAEQGLAPSPEADRATLLRRAALDLTGLPPSPEDVATFENDPAPDAFARQVDRLLASPRFGERWAAVWLDLARYADSVGYASDERRTIWRWRDWVIEAFNENMPFDTFTRLQMAGDLLPDAGPDGVLATAFHRNTLNNTEGGTDDEEFRTIAVKDRSSTTANVWMGLTLRCAECHSHKYDPISQNEFYQFLDFFNQTADRDTNDDAPVQGFLPVGAETERDRLQQEIARLEAKAEVEVPPDFGWDVLAPETVTSSGGSTLVVREDASVAAGGENPDTDTYTVESPAPTAAITALRLELLPEAGAVGRNASGSVAVSQITLAIRAPDGNLEPVPLGELAADHVQDGHRTDKLTLAEPDDVGWAIFHPEDGYHTRRVAVVALAEALASAPGQRLVITVTQASRWPGTNPARIRLATTGRESALSDFKAGGTHPLQREIAALENALPNPIPTPVLQELPEDGRRETFVNLRGNFRDLGDQVTAAVPSAFHPLPDDAPRDRLGLAEWLMAPENPLTARVTANRYWAALFGIGLVETEEDFGTQGTPPSHPDLLDWLAVEFRESGWDTKALLKTIVLSATYRQGAESTPEHLERDPRNRYLARAPRFRLPAETVRDQALAVAGLLSDRMFGPPVFPPNPVKEVRSAFQGATVWHDSEGEDRYRRALYTFLKRSQPHPLFETFDMNTRSVCSLRRLRTNTPLQSFQTLNDPAFVEAAQALARRMATEPGAGATPVAQIRHGLRLALARHGTDAEIAELAALHHDALDGFHSDPASATTFATDPLGPLPDGLAAPEAAALTLVANVILNLDAILTR
ncbi:PSD1 and planctomycete cytochrome C domain-containing protein [soil metagenome]